MTMATGGPRTGRFSSFVIACAILNCTIFVTIFVFGKRISCVRDCFLACPKPEDLATCLEPGAHI